MSGSDTIRVLEVLIVLLGAASLVATIIRRIGVIPYSVALVLLGFVVAAVRPPLEVTISPDILLAVLLPALVFDAAHRTDIRDLVTNLPAVALLAIPGVLITALLVAVALNLATGLDFGLSFLVGTMLAATDPAAILAVVGRLGAPAKLTNLIEAESLFNDGTGVAIFTLALGTVATGLDGRELLVGLGISIVVSSAVGLAIGFAAARVLRRIDQHLIEISISVVAAYGSYLIATELHESGLLATVVCGLIVGPYGRQRSFSPRTIEALDLVWEFIGFLATTFVFLLIGLAIGIPQLIAAGGAAAAALAALLVSRALIVYGLLGGSAAVAGRVGWDKPLPMRWLHLIAWAGLRGAVSIALALSLPADLPQRAMLQGIVFACVLVTLVVQGTSAQFLVRGLRLGTRAV